MLAKKRDFSTFGRQNVSQTTVLASFGVQIVIVGLGVAAFTIARLYKNLWIATLLFLVLAAISIPIYLMVLRRLDRIALAAAGNSAGRTLSRLTRAPFETSALCGGAGWAVPAR